MSGLQILGALIVALPFVALFAFIVRESGWREALVVFGMVAALVALLAVGVFLMGGFSS